MFESNLKCRCSVSGLSQLPHSSSFYIAEAKSHHAPDRLVDITDIDLDIEVCLKKKELKGSCKQTFQVIAQQVQEIKFDAIDLVVHKVFDLEKNELKFIQDSKSLTIKLVRPFEHNKVSSVIIDYSVKEPRAGLYFIAPDENYPNRPWQLWTQGQDQDNRYWIPCHDSPNEKARTSMKVTVDANFTAISNGRLASKTENPTTKKKTFQWVQEIPHASYLVTLCVGEFVELNESWKNSKGAIVPVQYFTLKGREAETKVSFGKTVAMLDFFSKKIGIDYPYEKYAQVVAWDFIYGGMENTSSTTQTEYTLHPQEVDLDYSSEPLVAHELAHQWFGDLLTCKEWSHAWLNEGFATYFESLWTEQEHGRDEFLYEVYLNEKNFKAEDGQAYRRPIVTNVYLSPSDIFDRHLYEKGGRVLHMLRNLMGETLWWKAIQTYAQRYQMQTVETIDLQRVFEEISGKSLGWFFEQWVFKGGYPTLKAQYDWNDEKKTAKITMQQTHSVNDLTPLFKIPLKAKFGFKDQEKIEEVLVTEKEFSVSFAFTEKPTFVSLNVNNEVLLKLDFNAGRELLLNQIKNDNDIMGRIFAAKMLAKDHSREAVEGLALALKQEKFWGVQAEIAEALGSVGSSLAFAALVESFDGLKHPRARKSAMKAIGQFKTKAAAEFALKVLSKDQSPLVLYEAGMAYGKAKPENALATIKSLLGKRESWHDYYDRGLLLGMAELKRNPEVLAVVEAYSKPGRSIFLRRDAITAMVTFAKAHPELVADILVDLTRDNNFFVKLMAVEALADLKETSGVGAIQRVFDSTVEPRTHRAALLAMKSLREGTQPNEANEKLKEDFDRLKEKYTELLSRVEKLESINCHK